MRRRQFLKLSAGALALSAPAIVTARSARAAAEAWPDKPVKVIVPYAPGGASDLIARPWAEKLSQVYGQQFVVENRGGAGGMIGMEAAAKAAPDGYTFACTPGATLSILPNLRTVPYDPMKSFTPVGRVGDLICGFIVHPSTGFKTLKDMVDYAKANPGKLSYGSAGLGTSTQFRLEMLKYRAKIDILHVPYRGSADALNDLLPGTIQVMNEINPIPHVKAGKLRMLNVNAPTRHPDFPDVPTLTECGYPDSDIPIWYSMQAPTGTPPDIVAKFNAKIVELANGDEMKAKLRAINCVAPSETPAQMTEWLTKDSANIALLVKAANIKLE